MHSRYPFIALLGGVVLAGCSPSAQEAQQVALVRASVDGLFGQGTFAQAQMAEASAKQKAAKIAMDETAPTSYFISHLENANDERKYSRYTITIKGISSDPDLSSSEQRGLLKQINTYIKSKNLCEKDHVFLSLTHDPLKIYDPKLQEARIRISCVI